MYAFFSLFRTQPGIEPGHPVPGIQKISSITPSVTGVPQDMFQMKSYLYTTHF